MNSTDAPKGPLDGVKVVELAHVMAGPTCGRMLADMGADVVKVERVPGGDDSRRDTIASEADNEDSQAFMMINRNKRGVAIDLKKPGGKEVLDKLLAEADVVVENYRHDVMQKLGFGYEELHERYPRLVYCAISGFGRTGPYSERGGFDLIAQGMTGLMSITGEGEGRRALFQPLRAHSSNPEGVNVVGGLQSALQPKLASYSTVHPCALRSDV